MTELELTFMNWCRVAKDEVIGAFGERLWSGVFAGVGLSYVRLSEVGQGKAAMSGGNANGTLHGKNILPDFDAMTIYADSKVKRSAAVFVKANNEKRHGINQSNWEHYKAFSSSRERHCALAVFEVFADLAHKIWSGSLLMQTLELLGDPCPRAAREKPPKVYWPRARFIELGQVSPMQAQRITTHEREAEFLKDEVWRLLGVVKKIPVQPSLW